MRCYNEEDNGIKSKRDLREQFFQKSLIGARGLLGKMAVLIWIPRFVELRPGNVCNVRPLAIPKVVPVVPSIIKTLWRRLTQ